MSDRVVVYARPLVRGRVKTRLAAGVGEARALVLYRAFLADVLGAARGVGAEVVVSVAGDPGDPGLEALASDLHRVAQGDGDLGARMAATFVRGRDAGVRRLALVGSDRPAVQAAEVRACLAAADPGTVVLAPAADGGYWCVAADPATDLAPVFAGVAWSTPAVLEQTRRRAEAAGLTVRLGPEGIDVDEAADLDALRGELEGLPLEVAPATRVALGSG